MVTLAHFIGRWPWAFVAMVVWALILWIMWQFARPPYDGMIGCPTNLPNCHDMPAPFPVEPWVVAAGFLGIVLVAWSQRQVIEPR